ncbi:hypothetical protein [Niveispirillum sp.]|uniref:hypothetical protein n=1 Tax=Niveispirillum sp. TaxID=1917217 RepID=UPI001B70FC03|nr:hypothetical protein [Niveispirillum sp.]MBP7338820.1 hypothetical protein [Niveispirillum sp.]
MPRYEETDFPPDIEVMVAASNWCLDPSPQGWARVRTAVVSGCAWPQDLGPVLDAIAAVRETCGGQVPTDADGKQAQARLSDAVMTLGHQRRKAANDIRHQRRPPPPPVVRAEDMPEDAPGLWWRR